MKRHIYSFIVKYIWAGLASSLIQSMLMALKYKLAILPRVQPYEAIQAQLYINFGYLLPIPFIWLLSLVNGTLLIGIVFGLLFTRLPIKKVVTKSAFIGALIWLIVMAVIFPILNYDFFGAALDQSYATAFFAAVMIMSYSLIYGFVYNII
jgi:xanthosine utilization system XapX-like protein